MSIRFWERSEAMTLYTSSRSTIMFLAICTCATTAQAIDLREYLVFSGGQAFSSGFGTMSAGTWRATSVVELPKRGLRGVIFRGGQQYWLLCVAPTKAYFAELVMPPAILAKGKGRAELHSLERLLSDFWGSGYPGLVRFFGMLRAPRNDGDGTPDKIEVTAFGFRAIWMRPLSGRKGKATLHKGRGTVAVGPDGMHGAKESWFTLTASDGAGPQSPEAPEAPVSRDPGEQARAQPGVDLREYLKFSEGQVLEYVCSRSPAFPAQRWTVASVAELPELKRRGVLFMLDKATIQRSTWGQQGSPKTVARAPFVCLTPDKAYFGRIMGTDAAPATVSERDLLALVSEFWSTCGPESLHILGVLDTTVRSAVQEPASTIQVSSRGFFGFLPLFFADAFFNMGTAAIDKRTGAISIRTRFLAPVSLTPVEDGRRQK